MNIEPSRKRARQVDGQLSLIDFCKRTTSVGKPGHVGLPPAAVNATNEGG